MADEDNKSLAVATTPDSIQELTRQVEELLSRLSFTVEQKWYRNARIVVDGYIFKGCRFDSCEIVTQKGTFVFECCFFADCNFMFGEEALKSVRFYLTGIATGLRPGPGLFPTAHTDGTYTVV